jgi:hypothetical protein
MSLTTIRDQAAALLAAIDAEIGAEPPPPPPPPEPLTGFHSFEKISATAPLPPTTADLPLRMYLHAYGTNGEGIYGDLWHAIMDESLGYKDGILTKLRVQGGASAKSAQLNPRDDITNDAGTLVHTFWTGYVMTVDGVEVVVPYTWWRLEKLLAWCFQQYPNLNPMRGVGLLGVSMGGWGSLAFGCRHASMVNSIFATVPAWKLGYNSVYSLQTGVAVNKPGIKLSTGEDFMQWADMVSFVGNPQNEVPFIAWAGAKLDSSSEYMKFQYAQEAVAALRAARRGFVYAWTGGSHSDANPAMYKILDTYDPLQYSKEWGYPVFENSSRDDPFDKPLVFTATQKDVAGINLGFKWRNQIDNIDSYSVEISNVLGETTVTVSPRGRHYPGEEKKTVTIPAGQWVTLTWP